MPQPAAEVAWTSYEDGFSVLSRRLQRIVRAEVGAQSSVIEDACQVAWSRLLRRSERLSGEEALGWLARTARREAIRQNERERRELSLEALLFSAAGDAEPELAGVSPDPHEYVADRERLALLTRLPQRQRRVLWMYGLGYSHAEIALRTGDSLRTVERQLGRARARIRVQEKP